jgi:hypothetical protein
VLTADIVASAVTQAVAAETLTTPIAVPTPPGTVAGDKSGAGRPSPIGFLEVWVHPDTRRYDTRAFEAVGTRLVVVRRQTRRLVGWRVLRRLVVAIASYEPNLVVDIRRMVGEPYADVGKVCIRAFGGCRLLRELVIPDTATSLDDHAFSGCSALTAVAIPPGVTSIGNSAFVGCASLTSLVIPNSVTSIGNFTFVGCTNLTSVTISSGLTVLKTGLFSGCVGLRSATIPDSVTLIGDNAFDGCTGLLSVAFPDSVTSIGNFAFRGCTGLTSVELPRDATLRRMVFAVCGEVAISRR